MKITFEIEEVKSSETLWNYMPLLLAMGEIVGICDELLVSGDASKAAADELMKIKKVCSIRDEYKGFIGC